MKLIFELGPFSIHFFGIMIALGIVGAYILAQREAVRRGYDPEKVVNTGIGALLGGLVGARIFYIVFYAPGFYLNNPGQIFSVHQGGLSIHGGLAGGLIIGWILAHKYGFSFWALADLFAPPLILAQAIGRVGCDVFGKPMATAWPWGINYQGQLVHPVQMYEFLLNLGLFWWLWQRRKAQKVQGNLFLHYIAGFLLIRGIVEFFRINPVILGFLSVSHLITLLGLAIVLAAIYLVKRPRYQNPGEQGFSMLAAVLVVITAISGVVLFYSIHNLL